MVDIQVEILALVPIPQGFRPRYRIKTWWTHTEVALGKTLIQLPRLPMIEPYLALSGKDTTIFIETWEDSVNDYMTHDGHLASSNNPSRFLGMSECKVDEQLQNPNLNPSIQWLDVYNPIDNIHRGRLLLRADAKFSAVPSKDANKEALPNKPTILVNSITQTQENASLCNRNSLSVPDDSMSPAFSTESINSLQSPRDQFSQTDFSLPVLPDISKYMTVLKAHSTHSSINHEETRQNSSTFPPSGQRQAIERFTTGTASSTNVNRIQDPYSGGYYDSQSATCRRNLLLKQHNMQKNRHVDHSSISTSPPQSTKNATQNHSNSNNSRRNSGLGLNMDNVENVIEILNRINLENSNSAQQSLQNGESKTSNGLNFHRSSNSKDSATSSSSGSGKSTVHVQKLLPGGSCSVTDKDKISRPNFSTSSALTKQRTMESSMDNEGYQPRRFKEIHFDGAQAVQQANSMMIKSGSVQPAAQPPRRRIAAAIFND